MTYIVNVYSRDGKLLHVEGPFSRNEAIDFAVYDSKENGTICHVIQRDSGKIYRRFQGGK